METKLVLLMLFTLVGFVGAQGVDNSTMTPDYQQLYYNNPIRAVMLAYTSQLGMWFYLILILGPYAMIYIYDGQKLGIASVWLMSVLAA